VFVGILVTTERPLIGAFLPSSMIVRLVSEILCKGIRDFLSGISEQGTGNRDQGSETTRVEVRGLPGAQMRGTWATHLQWINSDSGTWATPANECIGDFASFQNASWRKRRLSGSIPNSLIKQVELER